MPRTTRRIVNDLVRSLERVGFKVWMGKVGSKYHVTIWSPWFETISAAISFAGSAWQVERILRALSLGYAVGWESCRTGYSAQQRCGEDSQTIRCQLGKHEL